MSLLRPIHESCAVCIYTEGGCAYPVLRRAARLNGRSPRLCGGLALIFPYFLTIRPEDSPFAPWFCPMLRQLLDHISCHRRRSRRIGKRDRTMQNAIAQTQTQPLAPAGGLHAVQSLPPLRLFNGFAGAVLLLFALGLWAVPGSSWDQGAQLVKLFMTATSIVAGLALLAPMRRSYPEVTLDPRAERLELIERNDFGRITRKESFSYDSLSEVDVREGVFIARDHQGRVVVELPLGAEVEELDALRAALGPSFARTA